MKCDQQRTPFRRKMVFAACAIVAFGALLTACGDSAPPPSPTPTPFFAPTAPPTPTPEPGEPMTMTAFPSPPPITESIPQNFPLDVLPLPEDALFASSFQEGYVQRTQFISGMTIAEAQAFFESSLSRADDFSSRRMAYDVALSGTLEPWTFTVQISKSDAGGSLINIVAERAPTNTFRSGDTATEIPMDELLAAEDSTDAPPNTSAAATGTPSTDAPATGSASQPPGNTPR